MHHRLPSKLLEWLGALDLSGRSADEEVEVAAQKRRARKARWRKGAKERQETALVELIERLAPPFGAATLADAYSPEITEALRRHSVDWEVRLPVLTCP